jgi:hypothetical protein
MQRVQVSPRDIVLAAELAASSPERIFEWFELRKESDVTKILRQDSESGPALLKRNHPLIDLALARFSSDLRVLRELWRRGDQAIRYAVLMNETPHAGLLFGHVVAGGKTEEALASLSLEEVQTLFSNPTLNARVLEDFFCQREPWQALEDPGTDGHLNKQWCAIVAFAHSPMPPERTQRIDFASVVDGAWLLADRIPINRSWAMALAALYAKLPPVARSVKDPLAMAARWVPPQGESAPDECGDPYNEVRQGIVRLAVARVRTEDELQELLAHEDEAVSAAAESEKTPLLTAAREQEDAKRAREVALQAQEAERQLRAGELQQREGPSIPVAISVFAVWLLAAAVLRAFVISELWGWYVVPALRLPVISMVTAFGLSLLVALFACPPYKKDVGDLKWLDLVGMMVGQLVTYGLVLIVAVIVAGRI